jgi:hypothetical protein
MCNGCSAGYSGASGPGKSYSPIAMAAAASMNQQKNLDARYGSLEWNPQNFVGMYPISDFSKMNPTVYRKENESVNPLANIFNYASSTIPMSINPMPFIGSYNSTGNTYHKPEIKAPTDLYKKSQY